MRRRALLVGYAGGGKSGEAYLEGVSLDLENYREYLMSAKGGAWYNEEILVAEGFSKKDLLYVIKEIKNEENDITFTVFTGHGDFENKEHFCRSLLINENGEDILETELHRLSNKEITIFDCCSKPRYQIINESRQQKAMRIQDSYVDLKLARKKYERICEECPDQRLRFYSAEVGYCAKDSDEGGLYSSILLRTLRNTRMYMDIVDAHNETRDRVIQETHHEQVPSRSTDRVIKYLPGAIIV